MAAFPVNVTVVEPELIAAKDIVTVVPLTDTTFAPEAIPVPLIAAPIEIFTELDTPVRIAFPDVATAVNCPLE